MSEAKAAKEKLESAKDASHEASTESAMAKLSAEHSVKEVAKAEQ